MTRSKAHLRSGAVAQNGSDGGQLVSDEQGGRDESGDGTAERNDRGPDEREKKRGQNPLSRPSGTRRRSPCPPRTREPS